MSAIEYLQNTQISTLINQANAYQKSERTSLRLPHTSELGQEFITYVKDGQNIRKESSNIVSNEVVVARNSTLLGLNQEGQEIYNEWLVPRATVVKNYGQDVLDSLTEEFTQHKKKATVKAILLTQEVFDLAGVAGDTFAIKVSWSEEPMLAKLGDYLTSSGYSISAHDMKGYEVV
jgi:hypothetical protein